MVKISRGEMEGSSNGRWTTQREGSYREAIQGDSGDSKIKSVCVCVYTCHSAHVEVRGPLAWQQASLLHGHFAGLWGEILRD